MSPADGCAAFAGPSPITTGPARSARLAAPLGVHAVLGNHDWWEEDPVQRRRAGPTRGWHCAAVRAASVYENTAMRLRQGRRTVLARRPWRPVGVLRGRGRPAAASRFYEGVDDLAGTLRADDRRCARRADGARARHLPARADRVALTLAGHTHGGQVRLLGYAPFVPSRYGTRYVYGHMVEEGRNLIVSAGLGCSGSAACASARRRRSC